jgi:penicillin-insensitive murein endopeptidase
MRPICRVATSVVGLLLAASATADPAALANAWSRVTNPTPGPAEAIGGAAHGCLAGGVELPVDGDGYSAIRLSRRRNFGLPETVAFVEALGHQAHAAGLQTFYVGDMAQPRGGPLPFGHASHQTGLDVDIWFTLRPKPDLPPAAREVVDLPSMLLPGLAGVDPRQFGPPQVKLLQLAAADPRVDRIFVNPVLKAALCHGYAGAATDGTAWLHRLSPWWGHDDHFHVRLHCPADSPDCEAQPPVPSGDGCDATLDWWLAELRKPSPPPKPGVPPPQPPPPRPRMPPACRAVLAQP